MIQKKWANRLDTEKIKLGQKWILEEIERDLQLVILQKTICS